MSRLKIKNNCSGFTVIELVLILLIIAILATVLVFTYSGFRLRERNNTRISDLKEISLSLDSYFAANGVYPTLADMNSVSWRDQNFKKLNESDFKDPSDTQPIGQFTSAVTKDRYAYQPTSSNGGTCDNKTIACMKYTLTAVLEGGSGNFVEKSLN